MMCSFNSIILFTHNIYSLPALSLYTNDVKLKRGRNARGSRLSQYSCMKVPHKLCYQDARKTKRKSNILQWWVIIHRDSSSLSHLYIAYTYRVYDGLYNNARSRENMVESAEKSNTVALLYSILSYMGGIRFCDVYGKWLPIVSRIDQIKIWNVLSKNKRIWIYWR